MMKVIGRTALTAIAVAVIYFEPQLLLVLLGVGWHQRSRNLQCISRPKG